MRITYLILSGLLALSAAPTSLAARSAESTELTVPSTMCGEYFLIPIEVDLDADGNPTELMAIFDTGGNSLFIDPDAVERAGASRIEERRQITIRGATAGPLKFGKLRPYTRQLDHLSGPIGTRIDIFLPFRAFDDLLLTLDFPGREIRVARGKLPRPDGVEVFSARGRDRRPYLDTDIGGRTHRLLIDSGSSQSIAIADGESLDWDSEPVPVSVTQGMERLNFREVGRLGIDVTIAGLTVSRPLVTIGASTPLIGTDVMRRFVWTFDQRTKRVRIRSDSPEPLRLPAKRGTGAVMFPTEEGYEVARVLAGTPAARAGLRKGDLVLAVDAKSLLQQTCDRWNAEERGETTLTLRREGETFDLQLEIVELVP